MLHQYRAELRIPVYRPTLMDNHTIKINRPLASPHVLLLPWCKRYHHYVFICSASIIHTIFNCCHCCVIYVNIAMCNTASLLCCCYCMSVAYMPAIVYNIAAGKSCRYILWCEYYGYCTCAMLLPLWCCHSV